MIGSLDCAPSCKSCDLLYRPIRSNLWKFSRAKRLLFRLLWILIGSFGLYALVVSYVINHTSLSVFLSLSRCPVENLPIGRYFDLPWRDRSRSFVMRPFCDFSNKLSKLHDSSKLKFCCLEKLTKIAVYLLIVNYSLFTNPLPSL